LLINKSTVIIPLAQNDLKREKKVAKLLFIGSEGDKHQKSIPMRRLGEAGHEVEFVSVFNNGDVAECMAKVAGADAVIVSNYDALAIAQDREDRSRPTPTDFVRSLLTKGKPVTIYDHISPHRAEDILGEFGRAVTVLDTLRVSAKDLPAEIDKVLGPATARTGSARGV
jgi:hypothetical protein